MAAGADVMESVTPGQRCCEPKLSLLLCSALLARLNRLTTLYFFYSLNVCSSVPDVNILVSVTIVFNVAQILRKW